LTKTLSIWLVTECDRLMYSTSGASNLAIDETGGIVQHHIR
jgi:hypothetical protein